MVPMDYICKEQGTLGKLDSYLSGDWYASNVLATRHMRGWFWQYPYFHKVIISRMNPALTAFR